MEKNGRVKWAGSLWRWVELKSHTHDSNSWNFKERGFVWFENTATQKNFFALACHVNTASHSQGYQRHNETHTQERLQPWLTVACVCHRSRDSRWSWAGWLLRPGDTAARRIWQSPDCHSRLMDPPVQSRKSRYYKIFAEELFLYIHLFMYVT